MKSHDKRNTNTKSVGFVSKPTMLIKWSLNNLFKNLYRKLRLLLKKSKWVELMFFIIAILFINYLIN